MCNARILIVDDDPDVTLTLRRGLEEGDIYKIEMCKFGNFDPGPTGHFKKARVDIQKRIRFLVASDPAQNVLLKDDGTNWRRVKIRQ